ncbi:Clp protease N-terminal domain-containing protein [Plantactinospora siamensis]|uniref:Clp protease N-terminal domain-containing protein n=1 Tax=Plantactinospora siamensis TaxID=555372 RepID=A0ABV6NS88_9ACTN
MPSWFTFVTVEARTVVLAAGVTARQHGRTEVGAQDIALALLAQRDGTAADVWRRLRVDQGRLIRRLRPPDGPERSAAPAVRFDPTGRVLWDRANRIALLGGGDRLATRHLLLALLDGGPTTVVVAFAEAGITSRTARLVLARVPEIERLPKRPSVASRWRWRWTRWRLRWTALRLRWTTGWTVWRRVTRGRPVAAIAMLTPAAALFAGLLVSWTH